MTFFECSNEEQLAQECAILAERWNWSHEQIRELSTNERRKYVDIVNELYAKEKEAYDKAKNKR